MIIQNRDGHGSLTANGGQYGAGIGGGNGQGASDITITGGTVTAKGGIDAAGIGGGQYNSDGREPDPHPKPIPPHEIDFIPGQEVAPDTTNLNGQGKIEYYAAGTTANEIQNVEAEPVRTIRGTVQKGHEACRKNGHTSGEPVVENQAAATNFDAGSYDLVTYCTVCHEELSRETVHVPALLDPFTQFSMNVAYRIRTAPENGVVEVDADFHPGLQRIVFEALAARPDVTLKLTCRVLGQPTELTVPGGTDLLTPLGTEDVMTFEDMAKVLG